MAIAQQPWELYSEWIDQGGNTTSRTFQLVSTDTADDISAVRTDASAVLAAFAAASDAKLKAYRLTAVYVEDSLTLPTAAQVENNLQISAKIAGHPNKSARIEIPAPKETLFQQTTGPGNNLADFADPLLAAVVNLFKTTGNAYVSDGESITDQDIRGKRVHHKSSRG